MRVDLNKTVDSDGMRAIGVHDAADRGLAAAAPAGTEWREIAAGIEGTGAAATIKVLVSKPETFVGREGYLEDFIEGWTIPLPVPASLDDVCRLGAGGSDYVLKYEHFSTVQSKSRRMPMFVAVNINGNKERKITRTAIPWKFDGRLDLADQIGDEVYSDENNVLDRGHMVRREDPVWGDPAIAGRANTDTFHFTNSCPQMAKVNQVTWLGLENYILHNARDEDLIVSVFTGPVFGKDDVPFRGALIPRSFFKVVAVVTDEGRPSATGYEVGQEPALTALEFAFGAYKTYQTSIASIEEKTGLTFGDLRKYDGFSVSEKKGGARRRVALENLEMIRI
jgi:endonuclease G, mitochondrial